ncbi:EF-hand domain-containing protein [Kribbella sp. NPDC056861]|uniref:EF-hand domain-containing protein n=1 Tax=Kribbella sp. NPDC056861 TaxID=3154857 RepID=UPI003432C05B
MSDLLNHKLDRVFAQLDADGNGFVDETDVTALVGRVVTSFALAPDSAETVTRTCRSLWSALLENSDAEGDGIVSSTEFRAGLIKVTSPNVYAGSFRAAVDSLLALGQQPDRLTAEEWTKIRAALGTSEARAGILFDLLDEDRRGSLAVEQLAAAIREYYTSTDPGTIGNSLF